MKRVITLRNILNRAHAVLNEYASETHSPRRSGVGLEVMQAYTDKHTPEIEAIKADLATWEDKVSVPEWQAEECDTAVKQLRGYIDAVDWRIQPCGYEKRFPAVDGLYSRVPSIPGPDTVHAIWGVTVEA